MARMSIDDMIARDTRVDRLAKLCGWSRRETRACLEDVWALCYDRVVPYLPAEDIEVTAARDAISPPPAAGFAAALRQVGLAREAVAADRYFTRKDGTKVPWPDQNWRDRLYLSGASERVGYLLTKRSAGSEGGVKSGESRRSKTKHSFLPASSESQARGNPPDPVPDPSSAPDPEDQNSPAARAIPQVLQEQRPAGGAGGAGPAAEPPGHALAGDQFEDSKSPAPSRVSGPWTDQQVIGSPARAAPDRDFEPPAPPPEFRPDNPRAIGVLAETTWRRVSDAAVELAVELKLPTPIPFPVISPSTNRMGFVELKQRIREEGALAPTVCDRVVANLVKQAREHHRAGRGEASIEWLSEKAFGEKAWLNARNGVDPSARPAPGQRAAAPAPTKRAEPRPIDPVRSPEDIAAMLATAEAVAAAPERGREIAAMSTAELVKRFGGDTARAPPASAGPNDDNQKTEPREAMPV